MRYKIVVDSCGELPEELKGDAHFTSVPLDIFVDGYHIVDDETFDQADFLRRMEASRECPKSTCPSPELYQAAFGCDAEHVYAVTLSSQLSGSYNSAQVGKKLYLEENGEKQIHVFDSRSASVGETLIALKIRECEEAGLPFEEVVAATERFLGEMNTSFVLESLDALRKNGRLSHLKAFVASALNIKPIMAGTPEGSICQLAQARGMAKALDRMVEDMVGKTKDCREKIFAIAHCNCPRRAEKVAEKVRKMANFKDILILETAGISSLYASNGGVIVVA